MKKHVLIIAMVLVSNISNGQITPNLNSLSQYALLAQDSIISDYPCYAIGKVGTAMHSSNVIATDSILDNAAGSMLTAYNELDSAMSYIDTLQGTNLNNNLNNQLLLSDVYIISGNATLNGNIVLTGDTNSVFIFKISGSLNISSGATVSLQGVRSYNVFWIITDSAFIDNQTSFSGSVICNKSILCNLLNSGISTLFAREKILISIDSAQFGDNVLYSINSQIDYFNSLQLNCNFVFDGCNEIKNPTFDLNTGIPTLTGQISLACPWETPGWTPDYFHANAWGISGVQIPNNNAGCQNDHSGTGMAYAGLYASQNSREYIRETLFNTLNAGQIYYGEFFWSISDKSIFSVNSLGMLFTNNPTSQTLNQPIIANAQIQSNPLQQLDDHTNWNRLAGCFTASGNEQYVTIGNFLPPANTITVGHSSPASCPGGQGGAYYYIDDPAVIPFRVNAGNDHVINCSGSVQVGLPTCINNLNTGQFTYNWTLISGPLPAGISDPTIFNPVITLTNNTAVPIVQVYQVVVTSPGGCTASDLVTITVFSNPTVTISGNTQICTSIPGTLNANAAGSGPFLYLWSTGSAQQSITVSSSGTYTVIVTDANGCTATASVTVTVFSNPTVTISGNTQICTSVSGTLNANASGNGPFQYAWSTGSTLQSITITSTGTYTVTVTNQNGCTASASVSVTYDPGFTISISCSNGCNGTSIGSASVTGITGNLGNTYTYLWNTGSTASGINNLPSGTYMVTVTNQNGCTVTASCSLISTALPGSITINGPNSNCERDFVPHYYSITPYNSLLDNFYTWTINNHHSVNYPGNDNNDAWITWNPCEGGTITVTLAIPGCQPVTSTLVVQRCCGCFDNPITTGTTVTQLATAMNLPLDQTQQYFVLDTQSPIYFNGDFIMDANLIIRNSPSVRFGPGASIINTDHRLAIESSHLSAGCQVMWRGIVMRRVNSIDGGAADMQKEVGNPVPSVIEDAHIAFDMARGCKLGLHDNSALNRNYIGVQVRAINNLMPYDPLEITSASFDCTSALYPPYPGQSPVPNSNSYTGIHLSGCAYVDIGNSAASPITFNNLHYGIYSLRSNLNVYKCTFTNMKDFGYLTSSIKGAGIYAYGGNDEGSNQYYIHQYGHGKNGPLSFSNCRIGIYTDKMMAYLYDNHMNPVNVGVEIKESIYSEVFFNQIHAFSSQTLQARGVNLTANIPLSATSIKVYGNDLIIGSGTTSAGVYVNGAISHPYSAIIGNQPAGYGNTITMNGARYGIFGLTSNLLTTVNNTIDMNFGYNNSTCFGIYLERCPRSQHAFNTINGLGTPSVTNNINGFYVTDCPEGLYFCNHTDNLMKGFWYNTSCQNSWLMGNDIGNAQTGLYLTNTAVIGQQYNGTDYNGNLWTGNYSLFGAQTLNPLSQFNSPFKVEQGGNPQNFPSNNQAGWFTDLPGNDFDDCERYNHLTIDDDASALDELIASGAALSEDFINEVRYTAQSNLYRKLLEDAALISSSSVLDQFFRDNEQNPLGYFENIEFNLINLYRLTEINDSLIGQTNEAIELLLSQVHEWERLLNDSVLPQQDSLYIIQQIENALLNVEAANTSVDSLKALNLQLRQNELDIISMQNGTIQVAEIYDANRRAINAVKLNTVYRGIYDLTQSQIDTIYAIASQCAILGGPAVHDARGLYAMIDNTMAFDDYALCIPYGFARQMADKITKPDAVEVIPNPATGQVVYSFTAEADGQLSINLINPLGLTVHTLPVTVKKGQNKMLVNYDKIAPGFYRYQFSGALTASGKLVIIR